MHSIQKRLGNAILPKTCFGYRVSIVQLHASLIWSSSLFRTGWPDAFVKIAQNAAKTGLLSILIIHHFYCGKMWAISAIFKKLPNVNNRPIGENSPNLVTLVQKHFFCYKLSDQIPKNEFDFFRSSGIQLGGVRVDVDFQLVDKIFVDCHFVDSQFVDMSNRRLCYFLDCQLADMSIDGHFNSSTKTECRSSILSKLYWTALF
jgi:hypothetical protein